MDVLSDILNALKLQGILYFATEFTPPWGVRVPSHGRVARFHLVVRGSLWAAVPGRAEPVRLEAGDLVLVPHGAEHTLADAPGAACLDVDRVVEESGFTGKGALVYGGPDSGNPTRLVCGHFALDPDVDHPLLERLPAIIVIRREDYAERSRLEDVFRFIAREAADGRPGGAAVISRLSEVLFIQVLRLWAENSDHDAGLLSALNDPHLGESLAGIHEDPRQGWTLTDLARRAGLSRTVFAERFKRHLGYSPMQYVAFWRMQRARSLLTATGLTLEAVADQVGYESATAFHKVFKRWVGEAPGSYRRRHRSET